jgi:ketosteroid isomerase-like protein
VPRRRRALSSFDDFLSQCHDALAHQGSGSSAPFLSLWSHSDPTIMAAVGGYQSGFEEISALLSGVSQTLDWDGFAPETLAMGVGGDLAFTVELERMTRTVDGVSEEMTIRATQVYRRQDGSWKVIHRHGDVLTPYKVKW